MAILTATLPLTGGGDMETDIAVAIPLADATHDGYLSAVNWSTFNSKLGSVVDATGAVKGVVRLSVDPTDPVNPIAWGKNDNNVEVTTNKVAGFSSPSDAQYPSALLVANQLLLKADKITIAAGTGTKVTWNTQGIITAGEGATTADIGEVADIRYVTDAQHTALLSLSGINTGDQDLSPYALQSSLDTTDANVATLSSSLIGYATVADLATTNATVDAINSSLSNYALVSDLATTNTNLANLSDDLSTNYTPLTTHNTLEDNFNILLSSLLDPEFIRGSTAAEVKLTFADGLTRDGDVVSNSLVAQECDTYLFYGNNSVLAGPPGFVTIFAEFLGNGVTGVGKVVLDSNPTFENPVIGGQTTVKLTDSDVSTAPSVLVVEHDFAGGGVIVPGFGATIEFRGRTTTTSGCTQGAIRTVWSDPTDGTRDSNMVFSAVKDTFAVDYLWLRSDGSMALGTNSGNGLGVLFASGGFQTAGVGVVGQVLVDDGVKFIPGRLDASQLGGQFGSCPVVKTTTTDQTVAAEQTHFTVPVAAGSSVGTTWRIVAWGNIDNGANATALLAILRWGGLTGTAVVQAPVIVSPATAQVNKPWRLEAYIIITSVGAAGTARSMISATEYTSAATLTGQSSNSGATDVINVNTTVATTMVLTWTLNTITGAPHVRTFGALAELVRR